MKRLTPLIIITLVVIALASCTSAEPASDGWQTHEYEELGVTFELPEGWAVQETEQLINIANTAEGLSGETVPEVGASITLVGIEEFDGYSEPRDLLGFFMDYFEYGRGDTLERIGDPELTTIQNLPAATVAYDGAVRGNTGRYTAAVIVSGERVALVFTMDSSVGNQYQKTLERFTESVFVRAPGE